MAIYYVTSNSVMVERAKGTLLPIFDEKNFYQIHFGKFNLIVADKRKRPIILKKFTDGIIYIEGTIFFDKYWNNECLSIWDSKQDCIAFLKKRRNIFGHYTVVDISKDRVEIFSDPIGMINNYYFDDINFLSSSNDSLLLAKIHCCTEFNLQAVYEFIAQETNVGDDTVFTKIKRLGLGYCLSYDNNMNMSQIYEYYIENIDKDALFKKIENYFTCLNHYKGIIIADISAGYDTRTVLSVGRKFIQGLFGNNNHSDDGIDNEISFILSSKLGVNLQISEDRMIDTLDEKSKLLILHGSSAMRNYLRSYRWSYIFEEKFNFGSMVLSGYGGEVIRAKYCKFKDLDEFVHKYYFSRISEKNGFDNYYFNIREKLEQYVKPIGLKNDMIANWFYTIDKMRIWGSGLVEMNLLFGEQLHPFMDWSIVSAILGFDRKDLDNAALQEEIIRHFSGEMFRDIPINKHLKDNKLNQKVRRLKKVGEKVASMLINTISKDIEQENMEEVGIHYIGNREIEINRMNTILAIKKYIEIK